MYRFKRHGALAAVLALLAALPSCAPHRVRLPGPDAPNVGYNRLQEVLGEHDFTPLAGRRILLDPGHGGRFPGVVGLNGTSEADVNLGVALILRDLLADAGAEVHLTRATDRDFLTPADSTLSADLAARVAVCDSLQPDVFLSLHHNSNAQLDRHLNETQTYYPVGRDGAELDLARAVHKHLVKNLEISPASLRAGNFYVLRNAPAVAVLGEPSMLSHPGVEAKLSDARFQELEAQAYFLGLLEYFAGGNPGWEAPQPGLVRLGDPLVWQFVPDSQQPDDAPGLEPGSVVLKVDGEPVDVEVDADGRVTWRPTDRQPSGSHRFDLRGRSTAGRTTAPSIVDLELPVRQAVVLIETISETGEGENRALLHWRTTGSAGEPVAIANQYWWDEDPTGDPVTVAEGWTFTKPGLIRRYTFSSDDDPPRAVIQRRFDLPPGARWIRLHDEPGTPGAWKIRHYPATGWADPLLRRAALNPDAPYVPRIPDRPLWLEKPGRRPLLLDATGRSPWGEACDSPADSLTWRPLIPALLGRTILIDPAGGAADDDGTAPLGTPGRELNLRVAERLAGLLRGAGATVELTRTRPDWVADEAKVLQANRNGAALFITLRRARDGRADWSIRHHYGSRGGSRWAALAGRTLGRFTAPDTVAVAEGYDYLLRHTACPAVDVALPLPVTLDDEERWLAPAYQQTVASELFNATCAWFAGPELLDELAVPLDYIVEHSVRSHRANAAAWIRVDGNWLWLPPRPGDPAGRLPLSGPDHTFEVKVPGGWELLLSAIRENDAPSVWPFWTESQAPVNPFAEDVPIHE